MSGIKEPLNMIQVNSTTTVKAIKHAETSGFERLQRKLATREMRAPSSALKSIPPALTAPMPNAVRGVRLFLEGKISNPARRSINAV